MEDHRPILPDQTVVLPVELVERAAWEEEPVGAEAFVEVVLCLGYHRNQNHQIQRGHLFLFGPT